MDEELKEIINLIFGWEFYVNVKGKQKQILLTLYKENRPICNREMGKLIGCNEKNIASQIIHLKGFMKRHRKGRQVFMELDENFRKYLNFRSNNWNLE